MARPDPTPAQQRVVARALRSAAERYARSKLPTYKDKAAECHLLAIRAECAQLSDRELEFAKSLAKRAGLLETRPTERPKSRPSVRVKKFAALMLGKNRLRLNRVVFTRYSGERVIWCAYDDENIGRIVSDEFLFAPGSTIVLDDALHAGLVDLMERLDADTRKTIGYYGLKTGDCPFCGELLKSEQARKVFGVHSLCYPAGLRKRVFPA